MKKKFTSKTITIISISFLLCVASIFPVTALNSSLNQSIDIGSYANTSIPSNFNVADFGAKGDGVTDDTRAIQQALNALVESGGKLVFPQATYKINGTLTIRSLDKDIIIEGNGSTLDGKNASIPSGYFFYIDGKTGVKIPLQTNIVKGTKSITLPVAVKADDYFLIKSTDLFNTATNHYYKGEIIHIASSDGTLTQPTYDSYNHETTICQQFTMPKLKIENLKVVNNANVTGLIINYCRDVIVEGCSFVGNRIDGLAVRYCVNVQLKNNYTDDNYALNTGESYGIEVGSCQNVIETGNRCISGRHGIGHDGWIPYRDITIENNFLSNTIDPDNSTQAALDFHPNSGGNIIVRNNNLERGIDYCGGNSSIVIDNNQIGYVAAIILATDAGTITFNDNIMNLERGFYVREMTSNIKIHELIMDNNNIQTNAFIKIGNYTNGNTLEIENLKATNCVFKSSLNGVMIGNHLESAKNTTISNLYFENCDFIVDTNYNKSSLYPFSAWNTNIDTISFNKCNFKHYQGSLVPYACFTIFNNSIAKSISIIDCKFESIYFDKSTSPQLYTCNLIASDSISINGITFINVRRGGGFILNAPHVNVENFQALETRGGSEVLVIPDTNISH